MRSRVLCILLLPLLSLVRYSLSQVATGIIPFNSYGGGPFDTVNLGNLNVHFSVPVLHKPGRGIPFVYDLNYDSSIYRPVVSGGTTSWQPVTKVANIASYWGWQGLGPVYSPYATYSVTFSSGTCGIGGTQSWSEYSYSNFIYYDASGTPHPLPAGGSIRQSPGGQTCPPAFTQPPGTVTAIAQDGSGYSVTYSIGWGSMSGFIQNKDGTTINVTWFTSLPTSSSPYTGTDRNGNKISFSNGTYTDTLGQAVLTAIGSAPSPVSFAYIPPANEGSGTRVSVTVNFVNYTVKTNFAALDSGGHNIFEYSSSTAVALVDNITLPDGTKYTFQYEPTPATPSSGACTPLSGTTCTTGRILSVTLPTGGAITYAYSGGANGIINDGSAAGLTRTLSSPGGQWTYQRNQVSGNHWQTTVTAPTGDNTVLDFMEDSATGNGATYGFYETQRQTNQLISGVQTPLLTTVTCWNGVTNCTTTAIASPITQSATTFQYPSGGLQTKTVTFYNGNSTGSGLVNVRDIYAFSSGPPTTLIRHTVITYPTLGNNITDQPGTVTTYDGNNSVLSQATYTYDEYSTYPLQPTTGTPQHGTISGARGNPTTIASTVIGATTLTRHFAYYDTGNVYKSYDVNGQITTYNYSTVAQGNSTKSCGNSFSTSVTLPISGLSSSASTTYDCIGGMATGATDLNGNSGSTSYTDPFFWRPASLTAPYTGTSTTTTSFTYTKYTAPTLANVESKMLFNSNSSVVDQLATVGLYGQTLYSQQREGPSSANYDSTQVLYDSLLRANKSSMPCVYTSATFTDQNQACPTAAVTTNTFDALGRVTQTTDGASPTPGFVKYTYNQNDVKQDVGPAPSGENDKIKQLEYDALGRLTSVCELTSLTGYAQCGQTNPYNGYITTYAYGVNASGYPTVTVTQGPSGSTQTRVYTYDLLGRLASEQNPENGTTSYTYDSDSSGVCSGTYTGDLVKLVDAKGNKICYQYDALHRVTSIAYPSSGPDAANTPPKSFVYDGATFNGTAMANPKGQLVEAYTTVSGSKATDEFFSYSARDEVTDTWECTPHSGTNGCASVSNYYHVTAGFWENGQLKTLSSSISGLPSQTYSVDPMGRTSAVSASSGQNPVTSTSYNLSTFIYGVTFGSGDSDQFTLDPSTGRMTQYKFNVGSQNVTGNLNWNPNGSLHTLAITNQLNSLDTQTCSYTHDDLSRIAGVGCINGATNRWNQQFTYDAFGNITKTVPVGGTGISFNPTYSISTNWISALPGANPQTDANGRMTNDGVHTYAWDVEGKMYQADTATLTHDAMGRMVEKAVGSTYTQIVYGPLANKFAVMNGQILQKAFVPLPAAQAVYTSTGLTYYRHKDQLGSSRLATTPSRTVYTSTSYGPFGEPYSQSGTTDLSFTGQDQDTVSGIYDFMFRKYNPTQGRWLSPDPEGLGAVNPSNPQSWNRYAYVMNNPMSLIDPLGLWCGWDDGSYDDSPDEGGADAGGCVAQGGTWYPDDANPVVPGESVDVTASVDQIGVSNSSNTGPNEQMILNTLSWILQNIDPKCAGYLTGVSKAITDLMSSPIGPLIGHATMDPGIGAVTGGAVVGQAITVNDASAFFIGQFSNSSGQPMMHTAGGYDGNTGKARVFILLHELGHFTNANSFAADHTGNKKKDAQAERNNNKLIHQNCKATLKSAGNAP
jgi:RHS repeat-associated protein